MPLGGALTIGSLAVGAGMKAYNMWNANQDRKKGQKALDELSKQPYAEYKVSPETQGYYSKVLGGVNNPMGMTAAEKANAAGNVNNAINTTLYNVKGQTGGNMARYLSGAFSPQIASSANNIAVADANMRNANYNRNLSMLGGAAGTIQNIKNMNTQNEINRRMMKEQALGQSILQNKAFMANSMEGLGSDLLGAGLTMGMNGFGKGYRKGNITQDQANAVAKGFNNVPNQTYGFFNNNNSAYPTVGINKPNYMPMTTYQLRK